jgi:hypothetical protein
MIPRIMVRNENERSGVLVRRRADVFGCEVTSEGRTFTNVELSPWELMES